MTSVIPAILISMQRFDRWNGASELLIQLDEGTPTRLTLACPDKVLDLAPVKKFPCKMLRPSTIVSPEPGGVLLSSIKQVKGPRLSDRLAGNPATRTTHVPDAALEPVAEA